MFSIYDGRSYFYQWDLDRKLIVYDETIQEVHFCNKTDDCSLVCEVYTEGNLRIVNVPNILLQDNWRINVYGYDNKYTKHEKRFDVKSRSKPSDYIYTETECETFEQLEKRMQDLEDSVSIEGVANAVKEYLQENPLETGATEEEKAQIEQNTSDIKELQNKEVDLSNYYTKEETDYKIPKDYALEIVNSASGEVISLNDSSGKEIRVNSIYGKTTQNGTPSPDSPVELVSAGYGGSIGVNVGGKNILPTYAESTTINGITFAINKDGSISVSGTAEKLAVLDIGRTGKNIIKGDYAISAFKNAAQNGLSVVIFKTINGTATAVGTITSSDNVNISCDGTNQLWLRINVTAGKTINDTVFPMVRNTGFSSSAYEPYKEPQTLTIPTPNGLPGIPVTSGGNYTDSTGQRWICDEVDFNRGVYVQRIDKIILNGTEGFILTSNLFRWDGTVGHLRLKESLSNCYTGFVGGWVDMPHGTFQLYLGMVGIKDERFSTAQEFKQYLANQYASNTPVIIFGALETPIETQLTAEQLAKYTAYTNYPNTTIYTDSNAGLKVDYVADTKLYIDNKFTDLQNAILSLGGNI